MKRSLLFSALAMLFAASNAMGQLTQSKLFIENGSNITTILGSSGVGAITLPAVTGTAITTGNLGLITTTGTIGSGIWQGTLIGATYGGTGVNNGVKTISLNGANFALSHGDNLTLTTTAATNVTLPTSGILATTANVSSSVNTAVTGTSGHLAAFTGTNSVGNTDLTGDVTTSGGVATTISSTGAAGNTAGTHIVSAINSASTTGTINLVNGGTGASTASGARTNLGLGTLATQNGTFSGTSSGTNTGDITLTQTGGESYLTLSGQALTANPIDLSTANATGTLAAGRFPSLGGDVATTAGSLTTTVSKVNGVSYGTSPSTNTVPVVTGTNAITYEAVPNTALANNSITIQGTAVALGGAALATNSSPTFAGETLSGLGTGIVHSGSGGALSSTLLVDADVSATAAIADSKLATISTAGKVANSATTATTASNASTIVLRDGSGNVPGNLTGNAGGISTVAGDNGKFLKSNGATSSWQTLTHSDVSDWSSTTAAVTNATNATNVATTTVSDNTNYNLALLTDNASENQALKVASGISYNPNTSTLNADVLTISSSGDISLADGARIIAVNGNPPSFSSGTNVTTAGCSVAGSDAGGLITIQANTSGGGSHNVSATFNWNGTWPNSNNPNIVLTANDANAAGVTALYVTTTTTTFTVNFTESGASTSSYTWHYLAIGH